MLHYCANLKAIRYESTTLNGIVDDKSHRVVLALSYNYTMRFIGYDYSNSLIYILSLSNSHSNVASIKKNRGDKSHRVIVALYFSQFVQHCWFNILVISASLNKNKEVAGENNDVEPTMLSNLIPTLGINLFCLAYGNVADDVFYQICFTDLDYVNWFSRYKRSCERQHLQKGALTHLPQLLQYYLKSGAPACLENYEKLPYRYSIFTEV